MWEPTGKVKQWKARSHTHRHTKARPVCVPVMELPWRTVKRGIMMTKPLPPDGGMRERRVKRSAQTAPALVHSCALTEQRCSGGGAQDVLSRLQSESRLVQGDLHRVQTGCLNLMFGFLFFLNPIPTETGRFWVDFNKTD